MTDLKLIDGVGNTINVRKQNAGYLFVIPFDFGNQIRHFYLTNELAEKLAHYLLSGGKESDR